MSRRVTFVALALAAVLGCTRAPFTNRSQLILISSEEESKLGAQAFQEVLQKSRIEDSATCTDPVDEVGRRLARVVDRSDYRWRFAVIDDAKQKNAFALPGGKVAVYTGLFPVARDTAGLAVVMGHEIAHVVARHGAERMSQGLAAQLGGAVLGGVVGGGPSAQLVMAAYGLGTQLGVLLPYSRTQESEADRIGLTLMARAGYDPREAIGFWERMQRTAGEGGAPPEFLSTHPGHGTRSEQIREHLPEALAEYERSQRARVETLPAGCASR